MDCLDGVLARNDGTLSFDSWLCHIGFFDRMGILHVMAGRLEVRLQVTWSIGTVPLSESNTHKMLQDKFGEWLLDQHKL